MKSANVEMIMAPDIPSGPLCLFWGSKHVQVIREPYILFTKFSSDVLIDNSVYIVYSYRVG